MRLRAVLFDVDFTIAKPGPDLGPEGYRRLGERFGLGLDPGRYAEARAHAVTTLERHPELDHDEEVWVLFTEQIVRGMGGTSDRAYECAVEMTRAWEHAQNFQIFEDVLPAFAGLRPHTPTNSASGCPRNPAACVSAAQYPVPSSPNLSIGQ